MYLNSNSRGTFSACTFTQNQAVSGCSCLAVVCPTSYFPDTLAYVALFDSWLVLNFGNRQQGVSTHMCFVSRASLFSHHSYYFVILPNTLACAALFDSWLLFVFETRLYL